MLKSNVEQKRLEARARRAARRVGLRATKSRCAVSLTNHGGLMLLDGEFGCTVAGEYYDLTVEEVLEICAKRSTS